MKKLLTITSTFLIALALSSAALSQQKPAAHKVAPTRTQTTQAEKSELKMISGRVTTVDAKAKILTVAENTKSVTFAWNDKTKITAAGHAVKPSALGSGARVTVHYMEKGGKNVANSIVITSVARRAKKQ
jgi:hypothetical protein